MAPAERAGPEDEKVTINIGPVDLGRIDLLVREGVFSSRTDFIRDAIRDQLEEHGKLVDDVVTRKQIQIGFIYHTKADLERYRKKKEKLRIKVLGVYKLGAGVTKELAADVYEEVNVLGSLRGPKDVVEWMKSQRGEDR